MDTILKKLLKPFGHSINAGMALPEVLVSLLIVGAALAGTITKMGDMNDVQRSQTAIMNFGQHAASISATAVNLPMLLEYVNNTSDPYTPPPAMVSCLKSGSGTCNHGAAPEFFDLVVLGEKIGGRPGEVLLRYDGLPCEAGTPKGCAYQVVSQYTPICGTGTTCDVAQSLLIDITILPLIGTDTFWSTVKRVPKDLNFTREVFVSAESFLRSLAGGATCGTDDAFNDAMDARIRDAANKSGASIAEVANKIPGYTYGADQFMEYMSGISWTGNPLCKGTRYEESIMNDIIGTEGPPGNDGSPGPAGPPGPRGPNARC